MRTAILTLFATLCLSLSACHVYHLPVQQGNMINPQQIRKLRVGMTKVQVATLLGKPVLVDVFTRNRWNYVYTFTSSHTEPVLKKMTLYFANNRLRRIEGRYHTANPFMKHRYKAKKKQTVSKKKSRKKA